MASFFSFNRKINKRDAFWHTRTPSACSSGGWCFVCCFGLLTLIGHSSLHIHANRATSISTRRGLPLIAHRSLAACTLLQPAAHVQFLSHAISFTIISHLSHALSRFLSGLFVSAPLTVWLSSLSPLSLMLSVLSTTAHAVQLPNTPNPHCIIASNSHGQSFIKL